MKKICGVFLLVLLATGAASAQCGYDQDRIDPFTGRHIRAIRMVMGSGFRFTLSKVDSSVSLYIDYHHDYLTTRPVYKTDTAYMLFQNGYRLKLVPEREVYPEQGIYGGHNSNISVTTHYKIQYRLSKEGLTIMKNANLVLLRFTLTQTEDTEFNRDNQNKLREAAICIDAASDKDR